MDRRLTLRASASKDRGEAYTPSRIRGALAILKVEEQVGGDGVEDDMTSMH